MTSKIDIKIIEYMLNEKKKNFKVEDFLKLGFFYPNIVSRLNFLYLRGVITKTKKDKFNIYSLVDYKNKKSLRKNLELYKKLTL